MLVFDENEFIRVCNTSESMSQAARKLNMHFNTFKRYAIKLGCYSTNQAHKGMRLGKYKTHAKTEDILNGKYPEYQTYKLKIRLIDEGYIQDRCQICGWQQKPEGAKYTPCELHHKNGDSHDHSLKNLVLICPNCHSLTDNYRSKNRAHIVETDM